MLDGTRCIPCAVGGSQFRSDAVLPQACESAFEGLLVGLGCNHVTGHVTFCTLEHEGMIILVQLSSKECFLKKALCFLSFGFAVCVEFLLAEVPMFADPLDCVGCGIHDAQDRVHGISGLAGIGDECQCIFHGFGPLGTEGSTAGCCRSLPLEIGLGALVELGLEPAIEGPSSPLAVPWRVVLCCESLL